MAKKSQTKALGNPNPEYVGEYVNELRDAVFASAVAGVHAVFLSAPGWGKTRIVRQLMHDIAGDQCVFIRCEGSTPPEAVKGMPDPAAALDTPARIEYNITGTPYDPKAKIIMVDEIFRPNDVVFDVFLDVLDRQDIDPDEILSVWGTSNFVNQGERLAAVRDRVGMWIWLDVNAVDWADLARANLRRAYNQHLTVPTNGHVPTLDSINDVRQMRADPHTELMIEEMVRTIATNAVARGHNVNPRRIETWTKLLYRVSAFYYERPHFETIHPKAIGALQWAWPTMDMEQSRAWRNLIGEMEDVIGSAIEAVMREAYKRFEMIASTQGATAEALANDLGRALADAQRSLKRLSENDKRIDAAMDELTKAYAKHLQGKDPLS